MAANATVAAAAPKTSMDETLFKAIATTTPIGTKNNPPIVGIVGLRLCGTGPNVLIGSCHFVFFVKRKIPFQGNGIVTRHIYSLARLGIVEI